MIRVAWASQPPAGTFDHQTFFQSEDYARLLALDNRTPRWLVAAADDGSPLGRWLLFEQPTNHLRPPTSSVGRLIDLHLAANHCPAMSPGSSLGVREEVWSAFLGFIVAHTRRTRPVSLTLRLDPMLPEGDGAVWRMLAARHGLEAVPSWSYVSDLAASPEAMFQRIKSDRRTKVRKGESDGITVEVGRDLEAFRAYYEVRCDSARRNDVGIVPWSHFQATYDALGMDRANRVFLARLGGRIGAAQLALVDRGFVTLNGVSIAGWTIEEKVPANDVLQWHVIKWAIENGMAHIDYVGADPQSTDPKIKAIDHYKSRWGTTLRQSLVLQGRGSRLRRLGSRVIARMGL